MEKTESNKLIAEFMGSELEETLTNQFVYAIKHRGNTRKLNDIKTDFYEPDELLYDLSWDWLMPVVEKIEHIGFEVVIGRISCQVNKILDKENPIAKFVCGDLTKKISLTHKVVVEFIKWYNSNK